jgi:hypothetical protein
MRNRKGNSLTLAKLRSYDADGTLQPDSISNDEGTALNGSFKRLVAKKSPL